MLADSAKIQEEDAAHINIARNYAEPWVQPLYAHIDVERAINQVVPVPYAKEIDATRNVRFRFIEAGHILGSAMVYLRVAGPDRERTLSFSGDMGRRGLPILKPTGAIPPADVLVCESTYGNRLHRSFTETVDKLYAAIHATIARDGKVLIPAFSLGRTQLIIHVLQLGLRERKIPRIPIFVDSPLASEVAAVYRAHPNSLSSEIAEALKEGHGLLGGDGVTYVRDFEESTLLATRPGPAVIIASSGMCDAGRIQQHLKQLVDDPRCTIVLVSYQATGTVGRQLDGRKANRAFPGPRLEQVDRSDSPRWLQRPCRQAGFRGIPRASGGEGRQGAAHPRRARAGRGAGRDAPRAGFRGRGRPRARRPGGDRVRTAAMSPDNAFLRTLLAQPDDDTLRLAMADWLDENDQSARAEFIRVQVELARGVEERERRLMLEARQAELLNVHEREWVRPLAEALDGKEGNSGGWVFARPAEDARPAEQRPAGSTWGTFVFRRGFVEYVHLPVAVVNRHGGKLARLTPVRELYLWTYTSLSVVALCKNSWLRPVTTLHITNARLNASAVKALISCSHFESLRRLDVVAGEDVSEETAKDYYRRFGRHLVRSPHA